MWIFLGNSCRKLGYILLQHLVTLAAQPQLVGSVEKCSATEMSEARPDAATCNLVPHTQMALTSPLVAFYL